LPAILVSDHLSASIIYYYYSIVFDSVGITDPTAQTGLSAGLSIATWFSQVSAVLVGKRVGRRTIILWVWPLLLLSLVGLAVSGWSYDHSGSDSSAKATVTLVWIYLIVFNFSSASMICAEVKQELTLRTDPILYSYPAEVQTFSMRTKGLLVWNTVTQFETAYVTFVDAVALTAISWKYYFVYMPLVIIQFGLVWRCMSPLFGGCDCLTDTRTDMVETKGYTLEEIATVFDGSSASLADAAMLPHVERTGVHEHDDDRK
jgi:SP family sugar:H+ symporter-like MFS transporter